MTVDDVRAIIATADENGTRQVLLVVHRKTEPRGERVRTPFGLGRCVSWLRDDQYLVDVAVEGMRAWLARVDAAAVHPAEPSP